MAQESQTYPAEVSAHLSKMLAELPTADRKAEMSECERVANGHLNASPRRESPEQFSEDLVSGLRTLIEKDSKYRNAVNAESPTDLVLRLLPSDGHLE